MKRQEALEYIMTHNHTGIKAGSDRISFLDIWMVVVDGRIFARSWGFAEKSWYNSFLEDPNGAIKCGDAVFSIKAFVPEDKNLISGKINNAYLVKYNSEQNIPYVNGIIDEKHMAKTMEFIIVDNKFDHPVQL